MRIKVRDGQFFVNGYPVRSEFNLQEGEERRLSYIAKRGAGYAVLRIRDGELISEGEIGWIKWGNGVELYPFETPMEYVQECNVSERSVLLRIGKDVHVNNFCYVPKSPLHSPYARYLGGQRTPLLRIDASTGAGSYLAVLSIAEEQTALLLEVNGDTVETQSNDVIVTKTLHDLRLRTIKDTYRWQGNGFEQISHNIECSYDHTFIREQYGRLLLEAVCARDEKEIRALLSEDLAQNIDALYAYFGEAECVREPLFTASPTAVALQKKTSNGRAAVTYDFSFEGNSITNIICLDE